MSIISELDLTNAEIKNFIRYGRSDSNAITSGNSILLLKEDIHQKLSHILLSKDHEASRPVPLFDALAYSFDYYKKAKVMEFSRSSPTLLKMYRNEPFGPLTHLISSATMINSLVNIICGMLKEDNFDLNLQGLSSPLSSIVNEINRDIDFTYTEEFVKSILQKNFVRAEAKVGRYIEILKENYDDFLNKTTLGDVIDYSDNKFKNGLNVYDDVRRVTLILNGIESLHKGFDKDVNEFMISRRLSDNYFSI